MRILASADVHGSRPVYDWLLRVAREQQVEAIVLAGDLFGCLDGFDTPENAQQHEASLLTDLLNDAGVVDIHRPRSRKKSTDTCPGWNSGQLPNLCRSPAGGRPLMRTVMFVQAVMTPRRLLFACLFLLLPALSEARCVIELRDVWRASAKTNPTGTVFQGVVRTVTKLPGGEVALLDVDRVWRGSTPRQITIYNVTGEVTPEGVELTLSTARRLAVGARYVIFTRQMSEAEGRMFGTTASATTLVAQGCGIFNVEQQDVRVLGRGRAPE